MCGSLSLSLFHVFLTASETICELEMVEVMATHAHAHTNTRTHTHTHTHTHTTTGTHTMYTQYSCLHLLRHRRCQT